MSDRSRYDPADDSPPDGPRDFPPLPAWIANRLLRPNEKVAWVRGPRLNPTWERYVTDPRMLLVVVAVGAVGVGLAALNTDWLPEALPISIGVAVGGVLLSIAVLGFFAGYFTRLVVTDLRVVILQGVEVCRGWNIDALPRSLTRYGPRRGDEEESRSVDLDALQNLFGGSDQFTSKAVKAFGKQLDQIIAREDDRPFPR
jgi:hypothetical protein